MRGSPTLGLPAGGLGALDAAALKKALLESAVTSAAVQTGLSISLNAIPVVGPAINGIFGLTKQLYFNRQNDKAMKATMKEWQGKISNRVASFKAAVSALQMKAAEEEYPAAQARLIQTAVSGLSDVLLGWDDAGTYYYLGRPREVRLVLSAGLGEDDVYEGLAGSWGRFVSKVRKAIKKVGSVVLDNPVVEKLIKPVVKSVVHAVNKTIATVIVRPITAVTRVVSSVAAGGLKLVGADRAAERLKKFGKDFDKQGVRFIDKAVATLDSPQKMLAGVKKISDTVTGYSMVRALDEQMAKVYEQVDQELTVKMAEMSAMIASPEYREALRDDLASALQAPDQTILAAAEVRAKEQDALDAALAGVLPLPNTYYEDGSPVMPEGSADLLPSRFAAATTPAPATIVAPATYGEAMSDRLKMAVGVGAVAAFGIAAYLIIRRNQA